MAVNLEQLVQLGIQAQHAGDWKLAEQLYGEVLAIEPNHANAWHLWGSIAFQTQNYAAAIERMQRAVELQPNQPQFHSNLGYVLGMAGRHHEAEQSLRTALQLAPANADTWFKLGNVQLAKKEHSAAQASYRRAIELQPTMCAAYSNLCTSLTETHQLDEAIRMGQSAIELDHHSAIAFDSLGLSFARKGNFYEALNCFSRSLALDEKNALTHFHRGLLLLALGRFEEGWHEYEWRFEHPQSIWRACDASRWQGETLAGRTLLLQAEQGFGDTLQFIRYAKILRDQGARVILECSPPLIEFIKHCQIVDDVVSNTSPLPYSDFHCPLLSLGRVMHITPSSPTVPIPYLFPEAERVAFRQPAAQKLSGFKVGIVWQGDPKHYWDRYRSLRLNDFAPLAEVPGVTVVTVQQGPGEEQLATVRFPIHVFKPPLDHDEHSFRDTAAVLGDLDLLISADTAVAHLGGGMGVPTWLLLNTMPDWRWGLQGETTPWYPTMRLFRQEKLGEWQGVFERIVREISALCG